MAVEGQKKEVPMPPIRHIYGPIIGFGVDRGEEQTEIGFLVTPIEMAVVLLDDSQRELLIQELTGGIVPVRSNILTP